MFRFIVIAVLFSAASTSAIAADCYELSQDGVIWPRTPETLCVEVTEPANDLAGWSRVRVTLTIEDLFEPRVVASFDFDEQPLLGASRIFELANPSNSLFNDLRIRMEFSAPGASDGRIFVGANEFYFKPAAG